MSSKSVSDEKLFSAKIWIEFKTHNLKVCIGINIQFLYSMTESDEILVFKKKIMIKISILCNHLLPFKLYTTTALALIYCKFLNHHLIPFDDKLFAALQIECVNIICVDTNNCWTSNIPYLFNQFHWLRVAMSFAHVSSGIFACFRFHLDEWVIFSLKIVTAIHRLIDIQRRTPAMIVWRQMKSNPIRLLLFDCVKVRLTNQSLIFLVKISPNWLSIRISIEMDWFFS